MPPPDDPDGPLLEALVEASADVVLILNEDGTVKPVTYHGSAHLAALTRSYGFLMVPIDVGELDAGQEVDFVLIPRGARW